MTFPWDIGGILGQAAKESLGRENDRSAAGEGFYFVAQLDANTFESVDSGGRWFVIPSIHPVTRNRMEGEEAVDFALDKGYLGIGFNSRKDAGEYSAWRDGKAKPGHADKPAPWWSPEGSWEASKVGWREGVDSLLPFNPQGRNRQGWKYSKILHDEYFFGNDADTEFYRRAMESE